MKPLLSVYQYFDCVLKLTIGSVTVGTALVPFVNGRCQF